MNSHLMCVVNKPSCTHNASGACRFGEHCHPCVSQCDGCEKTVNSLSEAYCLAYPLPHAQWRHGRTCPMATHTWFMRETEVKINPLKASRRAHRGG